MQNTTYIVIPAYNEARRIGTVIDTLHMQGWQHIIVVNDGSIDDTSSVATTHGARVISHLINRGVGAATATGITCALNMGAKYIITVDADGQFDTHDVMSLALPLWNKTAQMTLGDRFAKQNAIPIKRRIYNGIASIITYALSGILLHDSQCGLKGFTRHAASCITIETNGYEFGTDIIREMAAHKLTFITTPVTVYYSEDSMSKGLNFSGGVKTTLKLIIHSLMK